MLEFKETIFLGSGEYSKGQVKKVRNRLEDAFTILNGIQQPGHPDSEQAAKEEEESLRLATDDLSDAHCSSPRLFSSRTPNTSERFRGYTCLIG